MRPLRASFPSFVRGLRGYLTSQLGRESAHALLQRLGLSPNKNGFTTYGKRADRRTPWLYPELLLTNSDTRSILRSAQTAEPFPILVVSGNHGAACGAGTTVTRFILNSPDSRPLVVGRLADVLQFSRLWPLLSISSWDSLLASGKLSW